MCGDSAGAAGFLPGPDELEPELGPEELGLGELGPVGPRAGISYATAGLGGIGEDRTLHASQRLGKVRLARTDPKIDAGLQRLMQQEGRGSRVIMWLLLAVAVCMVLGVVVGAGVGAGSVPPGVSGMTYALALVISTLSWYGSVLVLPLVMVVSAVCAGAIVKQVLARRGVALAWGVAPGLGLGALLTAIHGVWWLAGFVGGLHGNVATIVAWVIVLAPVIAWQRTGRLPTWIFAGGMLAAGLEGTSPKEVEAGRERWRGGLVVLLVIGMGMGFVLPYAMVPPGVLWPSEYGGYDALSYHLPLAQEWYTRGWLAPVAHNVYSFLPSYVEGAFVHMAAMAGSPQDARGGAEAVEHVAVGLLAGDGRLVLSAQSLHALMLGFAAWSVAGLVRVIAERAGLTRDERARGAVNVACVLAAILVVTTPWMVVTGTLAYNEAPLVAMLAAALACALSGGLSARARGVLCGVLTGLACCIKPSALVLGAPMVGIAMLVGCWDAVRGASDATLRAVVARRVGICVGVCLAAGAVTLSPWLVRNAVVAGNPVFPFAAGVLGHGHWSEEQAARYAAAHRPDRGVVAAMGLLVLPDARVGADARSVQRYRGVTNPQWMPLMPMGAVGLIALVVMPATRRTGIVLGGGVMAVALAWAAMTHAQSRFLVVLVPIAAASAAAAVAVVLAKLAARGREERARTLGHVAIGGAVVITAVVWMTTGPAAQAARQSALATTTYGGPTMMTAVGVALELDAISRGQAVQGGNGAAMDARIDEVFASASPTSYAALLPHVDLTRVLLVGSATPLYAGPMAYFTAWDTWPLLTQMEKDGDRRGDPREWTRGLREEGYRYAIVDLAEVTRLSRSGYLDPRLTPERVGEWMRTARLVRGWGDRGVFLVDLRREPGEPGVRGIDGLQRVPSGGGGE